MLNTFTNILERRKKKNFLETGNSKMTQKIQVEILKPKLKHRWNIAEKGNKKLEGRSEENTEIEKW